MSYRVLLTAFFVLAGVAGCGDSKKEASPQLKGAADPKLKSPNEGGAKPAPTVNAQ